MNWLARLKKIEIAPELYARETTKSVSVVSLAADMAPMPKTRGEPPAANDPILDLDRWCWPHSEAMNAREIDTFMARVARFTDKGLGLDDAEVLADKLATRDRDYDERRHCLECTNLSRTGVVWSCTKWRAAGLGSPSVPYDLTLLLHRCDAFKNFGKHQQHLSNLSKFECKKITQ